MQTEDKDIGVFVNSLAFEFKLYSNSKYRNKEKTQKTQT